MLKFTDKEIIGTVVEILKGQQTPVPVRWLCEDIHKITGFALNSHKISQIIKHNGGRYGVRRRSITMREGIAITGGSTSRWPRRTYIYWLDGYGRADICTNPRCRG